MLKSHSHSSWARMIMKMYIRKGWKYLITNSHSRRTRPGVCYVSTHPMRWISAMDTLANPQWLNKYHSKMTPKSKSTSPGCTPASIAQSKMDSNTHSRYLPWQRSSNLPHTLNSWSHSTRMTYARSTDTYWSRDTDSPTMASSPTKCSVRTTSSRSVTPCRSVGIHSPKGKNCSSRY